MALPDSYTLKPGSIPTYFDAILNAQPPERFSTRFLEGLGFKSTNDRLIIGVLRDLGFLDSDGAPQERYFAYLDRSQSPRVLAEGIREAFSDLFAVRTNAQDLSVDEVRDKLRTLYAGKKTDQVIGRIAATFAGLCELADFSQQPRPSPIEAEPEALPRPDAVRKEEVAERPTDRPIAVRSLQYHINIVLPESRDQAVYDAIFKSLRDHLG